VDAFVVQELAEIDDRRLVRREELFEARGVPIVRVTLVGVRRIRRVRPRFLEQPPERLVT
jgi:hypothetical protein